MGIILTVIPLLLFGIMIAWGFLIGTRNVIIRIVGVAVSFVAALISVIILKNLGFSTVSPLLNSLLSGTELGESILEFLESAEVFGEAIMSISTAFAAPLVFSVVFVIFALITWIIGWIVGLILMLLGSDGERKKRSAAVIIPCAAAQALLTVFVLITPVAAYGACAKAVVDRMDSTAVSAVVESIDSAPVVQVYRIAGGKATCKWMTSFKVGEVKSDLASEADSIGRVVGDVAFLAEHKLTEYGEDEADAIRDLSDSLSDSAVVPALVGEVIYSATDAWLDDNGSFFGVPTPDLDEMGAGVFDETFVHILQILHNDARDHDALCADFDTVANTVVILAEDGIFKTMGDGGNALINKLSDGGTVRKLVAEFGANPGFKILIGDVTNIGMRAIGTALNIPENADEVYSDFTGSIADELTALNSSGKNDEEKRKELGKTIKNAFAESGIEAELDDDVVNLYAQMIIEDFGSYNEVTEDDIAEFFRAYSEVSRSIDNENEKLSAGGMTLLEGDDSYEYSSKAYAGKSLDEIRTQSGAGLLAEILNAVLEAQKAGKSDAEIGKIVEDAYVKYAVSSGKDSDKAKEIANAVSKQFGTVTEELVSVTANMDSSESMAENSSVVTLEELLVDAVSFAESLDSDEAVEREAEAIGKVFNGMGKILVLLGESNEDMQLEDLSKVAEEIGSVLDSLSTTGALGEENTGKLMTAVIQSETVREAADLDMASATELAKAATESEDGKVNYAETMAGIASGASVADKLADENKELTREDIRELLDNMNPQTAKVLNAYMTEKRVAGFGVPESKVAISTEMINNLLTEMGNKEKYSNDYESEIDGITTLFDLLNAATAKDKTEKVIFNHGDETGRLNMNAYDFTAAILKSDMVCNALEKSLNKGGVLTQDPFGLDLGENGKDYVAIKDALNKHYSETSNSRVNLIAALFGVER